MTDTAVGLLIMAGNLVRQELGKETDNCLSRYLDTGLHNIGQAIEALTDYESDKDAVQKNIK